MRRPRCYETGRFAPFALAFAVGDFFYRRLPGRSGGRPEVFSQNLDPRYLETDLSHGRPFLGRSGGRYQSTSKRSMVSR